MFIGNLGGYVFGQQYKLDRLIGTGGMGAVYLAHDNQLNRAVAVKILSAELSNQSEYEKRFAREAQLTAALQHPHIVPIYNFGNQNGYSYIVMRLLTGGSLEQRLKHRLLTTPPVLPSVDEVVRLLNQLSSALDYAHGEKVIHRDLKTSNVMFDKQGIAYIVDFGIARLSEGTSFTTKTGLAMGTPSYMSPEQWRTNTVTAASDQYALAIMIYAVLTGRLPFEADTPYMLMSKHISEPAPPAHYYRKDLPEKVSKVIDKAMAKDAVDRYEHIADFAQAFERAVAGIHESDTKFFTFSLPSTPLNSLPTPSSQRVISTQPSGLNARGVRSTSGDRNRSLLIAGLGIVLLVIVAAVIVFVVSTAADNADSALEETRFALAETQAALAQAVLAVTQSPTRESIVTVLTSIPTTVDNSGSTTPPTDSPVPEVTQILDTATALPTTATDTQVPTEQATATVVPTAASSSPTAVVMIVLPSAIPSTATPTIPTATPTIPTATLTTDFRATQTLAAVQTREQSNFDLTRSMATLNANATLAVNTAQAQMQQAQTALRQTRTALAIARAETQAVESTISSLATLTAIQEARNQDSTATQRAVDDIATMTARVPTRTNTPMPTFTFTPTSTPTACELADVNDSGIVDIFDVRVVAALLGAPSPEAEYNAEFDLDLDGDIDIFDLRRITSLLDTSC